MKRMSAKKEFVEFCSFISEHDFVEKYYNDFDNRVYGIYIKLILFLFKRKNYGFLWNVMEVTERLYPTVKRGWKKIRR